MPPTGELTLPRARGRTDPMGPGEGRQAVSWRTERLPVGAPGQRVPGRGDGPPCEGGGLLSWPAASVPRAFCSPSGPCPGGVGGGWWRRTPPRPLGSCTLPLPPGPPDPPCCLQFTSPHATGWVRCPKEGPGSLPPPSPRWSPASQNSHRSGRPCSREFPGHLAKKAGSVPARQAPSSDAQVLKKEPSLWGQPSGPGCPCPRHRSVPASPGPPQAAERRPLTL